MNRRDFNLVVSAGALGAALGSSAVRAAEAAAWAFEADVAECCSCAIPCPCNFARPTDKRCDGNRLIQIREGQVGGAPLAGIDFLVTFWMGKWTRIYVSDALSTAQYAAFDRILPLAFTKFKDLARSVERVKLEVVREEETIRFTTPASRVEMKRVAGLDGEPIRITGLPSPVFHDYVQYESVVHAHTSDGESWSHQGTNGFTSRMIVRAT